MCPGSGLSLSSAHLDTDPNTVRPQTATWTPLPLYSEANVFPAGPRYHLLWLQAAARRADYLTQMETNKKSETRVIASILKQDPNT